MNYAYHSEIVERDKKKKELEDDAIATISKLTPVLFLNLASILLVFCSWSI